MTANDQSVSYLKWVFSSIDPYSYLFLRFITKSRCLRYFILTILINITVISIAMTIRGHAQYAEIADIYDQHFPPMEIYNGELLVPNDRRISYAGKQIQIIVDTSQEEVQIDPLYEYGFIFRKNQVLFVNKDNAPIEIPYQNIVQANLMINGDILREYRHSATALLFVMFETMLLLEWIFYKLFFLLFGTISVGIVMSISRVLLPVNERLILAMTAMTPVHFIETIESIFFTLNTGPFLHISQNTMLFNLSMVIYGGLVVLGTRKYISPMIQSQS